MSPTVLTDEPFTYQQACKAGWSRKRLAAAHRNGEIRRVVNGVYVASSIPDTIDSRMAALSLVVSPHSVVCDRTAAWVHGIDVFGLGDHEAVPLIETCVFRHRGRTRRKGVNGRTRDLRARDLMEVQGVVVTSPLRTALDLGCCLGRRRALGALDQFMRAFGISRQALQAELPRYFRRRGVVQLRELVALADPRAESMPESWIRLDIHDAGLPPPQPQFWVELDGVAIFRLDLAYPKLRVALEYDGEEFHRRTPGQRARDRQRRTWLRQHGWTVIVIDKDQLRADPDGWLRELRAALRPKTRRLRWASSGPGTSVTTRRDMTDHSTVSGRGASSARHP